MRIMHICLGSNFTNGLTYQENYLIDENIKDGHEIFVITNDEYFKDGKSVISNQINKVSVIKENFKLLRLPFIRIPFKNKFRKVHGLMKYIKEYKPDIILFHGICSFELLTCKKYILQHDNCKLYVDTHADQYNSGTNLISKYILHKVIYRSIYLLTKDNIDKLLYIDENSKNFMIDNYHVDKNKCEFFPLGGKVIDSVDYNLYRDTFRKKLSLQNDDIFIFHSGKLDYNKKTLELIDAFKKTTKENLYLAIGGILSNDIKDKVLSEIKDEKRIHFLGWLDHDDLRGFLCACDLYAQPGTQSATYEVALCNRCACLIYPYQVYTSIYKDNVYYAKSSEEMLNIFRSLKKHVLREMGEKSYNYAQINLDYSTIVKKMY